MASKFSAKLVSLFLVFSVCLLGYTAMSTLGVPIPTAGKVAISDTVEIRQGANVSYYFDQDAYLNKLEVRSSYVEINSQFRLSTVTSTGQINITLEQYNVASPMTWKADPGTANPMVTFTLSGLQSGAQYYIKIDGNREHQLRADGSGQISFIYSDHWSEHTFQVEKYDLWGSVNDLSSSFLYLTVVICLVILLLLVVERVKKESGSRGNK